MRRRSKERSIQDSVGTSPVGESTSNMMDYQESDNLTNPVYRRKKYGWLKTLTLVVLSFVMGIIVANIFSSGNESVEPQPTNPNLTLGYRESVYNGPYKANAVIIVGANGTRIGSLTLAQVSPEDEVTINGEVTGLSPNSKHGFHIHENGDIRQGCNSTGAHFNPFNEVHGGPNDKHRHVGDLGNIETDSNGKSIIQIQDNLISLVPGNMRYIVGRTVVIHTGVDDLGKGGTPDSLKTGNAGTKYACGVIGVNAS